MKARLQVMKFGGTSVGDAACIARTAQIIAKAAKDSGCIAVVSAMSGVTNRLIEAAKKSQAGNAGEAAAILDALRQQHEAAMASLVSREEYVLAPGENRKLELPLNAETRFIAVVAAFRDIRTARWRAISRPPEKKLTDLLRKGGITVRLDKDNVTLAVKD